ncbi:MAG: hypothetical protein AAFR17_20740 [Pseudomonadota bacterium]
MAVKALTRQPIRGDQAEGQLNPVSRHAGLFNDIPQRAQIWRDPICKQAEAPISTRSPTLSVQKQSG